VQSQGPLDTNISLVSLRRFSFILGNSGLIPYDRPVNIRTDMRRTGVLSLAAADQIPSTSDYINLKTQICHQPRKHNTIEQNCYKRSMAL
jgi:hypothetical protein